MEVKQEPDSSDSDDGVWISVPPPNSSSTENCILSVISDEPRDEPSDRHMPFDDGGVPEVDVKREPDSSDECAYASTAPDASTEGCALDIKTEALDEGPSGDGHTPPDYLVDTWVPDIKKECAQSQAASGVGSHLTCDNPRESGHKIVTKMLEHARSSVKQAQLPAYHNSGIWQLHGDGILSGEDCSQRNNLLTPMMSHTLEESISCKRCHKIINARSNPCRHVTGVKPFVCEECEKSFDQRDSLIRHRSTHTKDSSFSRKSNSLLYLKRKAGEIYLACEYCKKTFSHRSTMLVHLRSHTGEKPFTCEYCKKSFRQKGHLLNHLKTHTGEKPFVCEVCNKSFSQRAHLLIHLKTHTGEKPSSCEDCKKSFSQGAHLLIHMKTHSGEKPFSCEICQKSFCQRIHLVIHLKTHMGRNPFSCKDCQKTFTHRSRMLAHFRTHTGEKPFSCEDCKKSFSQRSHFLRHLRIHAGEKPFDCEKCQKSFGERYSLIMHMKIHTEEKPYSCEECKKSFSHKSYFLRHLITKAHKRKSFCS